MTKEEIKNEIIFKQDLYIEYLVHAINQESILRDITLGVRKIRESEISALKVELIFKEPTDSFTTPDDDNEFGPVDLTNEMPDKLNFITDADIEAWAEKSDKNDVSMFDYKNGIIKGAKAVLNGEIKHITNG